MAKMSLYGGDRMFILELQTNREEKKGLIIHKHNSNNLIISFFYNGHRNEVSEC